MNVPTYDVGIAMTASVVGDVGTEERWHDAIAMS